ncbi:P-loop containing nucleoside triphosphate hydrolase protein [Flagelloscypha sp. PMI_526]|nr:P-loop containing nucleoside triphosphate hydrolase protein [Flagelloscypha sp. PMI_526]
MSDASAISNKVRCCFLGQPGLGKTTLVLRLLLGKYFPACDPTLEDTFAVNVPYGNRTVVAFEVDDWCAANEWETSDASVRRSFRHQEPRPVVLCFSLVDIASFKAVVDEWYPAIMKWEPRVKILLVGTKSDAQMTEADLDHLRLQHVGPIQREQCHALARDWSLWIH